MTVGAAQPRVRKERRIIERPRLIKLLDDTDARTILLLAPAGYGKTTLARQWAKTLNGAVSVTLTAAHRDVAVLATEVGHSPTSSTPGTQSFIAAYLKAHSNPQRRAREIAVVVAEQLKNQKVQWLVLDDYQEIVGQPEAEEFVEVLHTQLSSRFLIASRLRPAWATARLAVYGDLKEIGRSELALSRTESKRILGSRTEHEHIIDQANGWPAVIGLAASATVVPPPGEELRSDLLHGYFAEELFRSAEDFLRHELMQLALAPDLDADTLDQLLGGQGERALADAAELGFVDLAHGRPELHPLLRDFLLTKLTTLPESTSLVTEAIQSCIARQRWERAFELILRFERSDLVEPALDASYTSLLRAGRVGTLAAFASRVRAAPSSPPASVDLAEAELALADGAFELASRIAQRALARLPPDHALVPRANTIVADSAYAQARLGDAEEAYRAAFEHARGEQEALEALRGWTLASLQGETAASEDLLNQLDGLIGAAPLDVVRRTILELSRLHFTTGYATARPLLAEAEPLLALVEDPRARSSFAHVAAYVSALGARYAESERWQKRCDEDIAAFDLDFARPHAYWNHAHIALGLRKFGRAEKMLHKLEDAIADRPLDYHAVNARILRARLSLETGQPAEATATLTPLKREAVIPSLQGEYLAMTGLALSANGDRSHAQEAASAAEEVTSAIEVRVLAAAIRALKPARISKNAVHELWELAESLDAWDPLLIAVRAVPALAETLAELTSIRAPLACLYQRSNDHALARRAGVRTRVAGSPSELLSPREFEVLNLLARGYRNQQIADALVVSLSTVKVHVRHVFEKLGVRSRAEAVTRLVAND